MPKAKILLEGVRIMVKPMQLGHTNLWVTDLGRAERFYTEALGLGVAGRRENGVNLSAREHSQELVLREVGPQTKESDINAIGTAHLAWEMASFDDLQAMCNQLKSAGVELKWVRSVSYAVGVYFDDPDGNSIEAYYEDVEAFRRRPEPGEYHRKLEGLPV